MWIPLVQPGSIRRLLALSPPGPRRDPLQSSCMTTSRGLNIVALALITVTMLGACGSQDQDFSGGPMNAEASEQTGGVGAPSDWQEVKIDAAQVHLPPHWTILDQEETSVSFAAAKDELGLSPGSGTITTGVNSPSGDVKADLERTTEFHLETFNGDPNLKNVKRLPDVTIDGVLFSHIQWEVGPSWRSEYVAITPDDAWSVTIGWGFTMSGLDRNGSQELIDPVMETFGFR